MCGPAAPFLAAGAAVLSAAGTIQGGLAAKAQGKYQAAVATQNASLANAQARDAMDRGRIEQVRLYRQQSQLQGRQQAAFAANGIDAGFGSALDVAEDTAMIGQEDALTLNKNTLRETKGYEISAGNYKSEAYAAKAKGKAAFTNSLFSAGSTLLGGASQFGKMNAASRG